MSKEEIYKKLALAINQKQKLDVMVEILTEAKYSNDFDFKRAALEVSKMIFEN